MAPLFHPLSPKLNIPNFFSRSLFQLLSSLFIIAAIHLWILFRFLCILLKMWCLDLGSAPWLKTDRCQAEWY